eukprot:3015823-Rhodomonas_salina.1
MPLSELRYAPKRTPLCPYAEEGSSGTERMGTFVPGGEEGSTLKECTQVFAWLKSAELGQRETERQRDREVLPVCCAGKRVCGAPCGTEKRAYGRWQEALDAFAAKARVLFPYCSAFKAK